jgi:uncharacterized RDD family membrane protein YckC
MRLGYINLTAYALFLIGAIAFSISDGKETRLIRFFASIIFMESGMSVAWLILTPFFYSQYIDVTRVIWMITSLIGMIKALAFCYFSYKILRYFNEIRVLETRYDRPDAMGVVNFVPSSNGKRFANAAVDLFICICLFSPMLPAFAFLAPIEEKFGEQTALWLFVILSRLIYYIVFESVFKATPGKFITESRVLTDDEQMPNLDKVLGRTFARFIPFEAFSFFGDRGWHDSISKTKVVDEIRTGVNGARYLLIFPMLLVVGILSFIGVTLVDDYKSYLYNKRVYDEKVAGWKHELSHLNTSHIIEIEIPAEYSYPDQEIHLKVEIIDGDEVTCSVVMRESTYETSLVKLERLYSMMKSIEANDMVTFKLADLNSAYNPEYAEDVDETFAADFLGDGKKYRIVNIDRLFGPSIHDRGTGGISTTIGMDLLNYGWTGSVTKIENLEGNIEWESELPVNARTVERSDYPDFNLSGRYERGTKYKFRITVTDSLERLHYFEVEGTDLQKTVRRVD